MRKTTVDDSEARSIDIVAENVAHLRTLFPEAFTEDKIDFEVLKQLLGSTVDDHEEKYGLNWYGKRQARQLALTPSSGTLRPAREESVDWNTTQNLMIEGDNLEVLKLLQKSYAGKVKLIYIDPPYNTGRDFIYPDNYRDNIRNYLELTGQVDDSNQKLSSNTEASGRFHTDWLNMIYPRLKLARNLLRPDGIVFVSISDHEVAGLRHICNEVFGEENFFAILPWQSRTSIQNDTDLSVQHEYLVGFARHRRVEHRRLKESNFKTWFSLDSFAAYPLPLDEKLFSNPDNDPRGAWKPDPFDAPNIRDNLTYPIINPNTGVEHWPPPGRCWRTDASKYASLLEDNRICFGKTGNSRPQLKVFFNEKKLFGKVPNSWCEGETFGTVTFGTQELQELFEGRAPFSFPKPTKLLREIFKLTVRNKDIVLDFFAGSGTTGHAVLADNATEESSLRYILIQLPEPLNPKVTDNKAALTLCDEIGKPSNVAEITKERLRRTAVKIKTERPKFTGDLGFRVFKLDSSNIRTWEPDRDDLEGSLLQNVEHIKSDRSEDDILYELLLKLGLDLCVPIETSTISGKSIHSIGAGTLIACLDEKIDESDIEVLAHGIVEWHEEMKPTGETTVVFRDSAFADDIAKTNLTAILEQRGLRNVRSL